MKIDKIRTVPISSSVLAHYAPNISNFYESLRMPNPASLRNVKVMRAKASDLTKGIKGLSKGLGILGWALLDIEIFKCIKKCIKCLRPEMRPEKGTVLID